MRCFQCVTALSAGVAVCCAVTETMAQSPGLLAAVQVPAGPSFAAWLLGSLGFFGLLTLLAGAAVFLGACLVVCIARRPAVIACYLVFLLLPMLLSVLGALKGCVASFSVLARVEVEVKQTEIFAALSETVLLPLSALIVTLPSYFVTAVGLFVRTALSGEQGTSRSRRMEPPPGVTASAGGPPQT